MGEIESAGYQATGLILGKPDKTITTMKQDTNATKFLARENVLQALAKELDTVVGHCRMPTKGDVKFERNNHPFRYGSTVLVHQGILWNDVELNKKYDFKPEGETDSWTIVYLIEKYRKEGKNMVDAIACAHEELKGSWGVVLIDILEPDKLYIFCHSRSIKINYYPDEQLFFFSSDENKLDKCGSLEELHFGIFEEKRSRRMASYTVKDEDLIILGGKEQVETWSLPEPENYYSKKNKRFGDGWKDKKEEDVGRQSWGEKVLALI